MKNTFLCLVVLICCTSATAQLPQAFNYQGIARNSSGSPLVNTNISLRISILQGALPGTEVYREDHSVLTNKLGVFSIAVGGGNTQIGQFDAIDWGADSHSIQIEMDPDGGSNFTLLGASPLLSVPYALYAGKVSDEDLSWKENAKGIHYTQGNVGIGTNNPDSKLTIEGTDGTGTGRNYLNFNNQSTSNRSLVFLQMSAGEPNSFTSLQHIAETYDFEGDKYTDFGVLASTGKGLILRADATDGIIKFLAGGSALSTEERMRITESGLVGIGTQDPSSRLQISDGDVFIENINNGVIMKSPNGNCWRLTINNDGTTKTTAIACPN